MAKFDLNDSGVVVIVGSGAGGGTLGNELAQKGVKVVILEAGARVELQDFVNDEWESFTQLAWSDMRTTSGSWRVAKDFPNLPAWIVKAVGGSTTHWAGASLRFDEHEFKAKNSKGLRGRWLAQDSGDRDTGFAVSLWDNLADMQAYEQSALYREIMAPLQPFFVGDYKTYRCEVKYTDMS